MTGIRRLVVTATALAAALAFTGAMPTPASAATTPCVVGTPVASDFDGDGKADLVVGFESEVESAADLQGEWILPGDGGAATWIADSAELVSADLNGDTCADAILMSGRDGLEERYGQTLELVPGTPAGLDRSAASTVTIPQVSDRYLNSQGEFRAYVEVAGLRHDGISQVVVTVSLSYDETMTDSFVDVLTLDAALDVSTTQVLSYPDDEKLFTAVATDGATVAVGAPYDDVHGKYWAGAVYLYTPDSSDPTQLVRRLVLTQDSAGVPGTAENGDQFGYSLAFRDGRLAIGVPFESDGKIDSSGAVQPIRWNEAKRTYTAYRQINQDTKGVPGTNEAGDCFGRTLAIARGLTAKGSYDILIGANEGYGKRAGAGSVTVANFTKSSYRTYTQATKGVPGTPEKYDAFSIVGVLATSASVDTVLIGAPGEDNYTGYVIRSDGKRLTSKTTWTTIRIPSDAPATLGNWGSFFGR